MDTRKVIIALAVILCIVPRYNGDSALNHLAAQETGKKKEYTGVPATIAHLFLEMESPLGATGEAGTYLTGLINRALGSVPMRPAYTTEEAVLALRAIDSLLKSEGFRFKNNLLLGRGIAAKSIDCDNYAALYTSIGEVLRIPIVPVYAPGHSFVRFCFDDGTYLDWEPIEGVPRQDAFYVKRLNIAKESIDRGVYLKTLSRKEFIGVQYNNIGAWLLERKKYRESVPLFSKAVELYPLLSSAYHNRGSALSVLKMPKKALEDLERAAGLDPNRASTYTTLGDVCFDLNRYERALGYYRQSIRCDPGNYVPYHNIAALMQQMGRKDEAARWMEKAREVKSRGGR
ncbi:MAG: tetratricopeptide repeat protein [Spirochaetes bacterium]|nr:tetratricopeptide repeat protein [Spirochaetota bacterium]